MKHKLTYKDYCLFFSKKCDICKGARKVLLDNVWTVCLCQFKATLKFRYDSLQVYPPELKYKTWNDFTGIITEGGITSGILEPESVIESKQKALSYCYKNGDNSSHDNLIVQDHLNDGQNVIIYGERGTGKTLLAVLILKEIVFSNYRSCSSVTTDWVHSSQIRDAARWALDSGIKTKEQDYDYLDEISLTDFLVIDDIDYADKRNSFPSPPDRTSLDVLFGERKRNQRPTIFICSNKIKDMVGDLKTVLLQREWGNEFYDLISNSNNVIIELRKSL